MVGVSRVSSLSPPKFYSFLCIKLRQDQILLGGGGGFATAISRSRKSGAGGYWVFVLRNALALLALRGSILSFEKMAWLTRSFNRRWLISLLLGYPCTVSALFPIPFVFLSKIRPLNLQVSEVRRLWTAVGAMSSVTATRRSQHNGVGGKLSSL